eukprot:6391979-Amphidinium_carterae.2
MRASIAATAAQPEGETLSHEELARDTKWVPSAKCKFGHMHVQGGYSIKRSSSECMTCVEQSRAHLSAGSLSAIQLISGETLQAAISSQTADHMAGLSGHFIGTD